MITRESLGLATPYEAPSGELEKLIAGAFAEVFELDKVGANDEFFDIGGDSLLAETLSIVISERTGRDFQISALIEHGSPRLIAALLRGESQKTPKDTARPPIFLVHGRAGFTLPRPDFRQALAKGQALHVFELPGVRGGRSFESIQDIAGAYVAQLVERHPEGPILLSGFCTTGGLIAIEMAYQLAKLGRPIHQLLLLDPGLPKHHKAKRQRKEAKADSNKQNSRSPRLLNRLGGLWRLTARKNSGTHKELTFVDYELRERNQLLRQKERGRGKYLEQRLPVEARAKLRTAFRYYKPRPFHGPVVVLSAPKNHPLSNDPSKFWSRLLPQRQVHLVFNNHDEISSSAAAQLIQSIFDATLAGADVLLSAGRGAPEWDDTRIRADEDADINPRA